ncbi:hypothetical protein P152DRAFT_460089 [Eremomyces bilateralis CBS 781.70]|uniref:Mtf2-like C-terminal domain-containing protein n=1 Tax=Eremomyces bilateralis CBS 781.70 TaxID=1392243 RepID=A0A6G1FYF3_9PEZI|nr:uncharacterized protein P152DRAFT_460089 [Eremomyces bilateralis CBS 781.70]KAF1810798.1 hypothetical protein P152DRAFT_460089 [Eremomyces bilateralis CBS 781.70]
MSLKSLIESQSLHRSRGFFSGATLTPFLYQTPTIQRHRFRASSSQTPKYGHSKNFSRDEQSPIRSGRSSTARKFNDQGELNRSPPKTDAEQDDIRSPPSTATITPKEEKIFAKLFQQMVEKNAVSNTLKMPQVGGTGKVSTCQTDALGSQAFVQQFPESLRPMARQAAGKLPLPREQNTPFKPAESTDSKVETAPEPESEVRNLAKEKVKHVERVQKLLETASTDAKLWQVLETQVFGPIAKLDLDGEASSKNKSKTKTSKTKEKKKAKGRAKIVEASQEDAMDEKRPNQEVFKAIPPSLSYSYPHLLLHAVRVLKQTFPTSLLSMTVLPHMKSIGRSSYILGVSAALYNETIRITWAVSSDFSRVENLLNEMTHGGIDANEETLDILFNIKEQLGGIELGNKGEALRAIWATESFKKSRADVDIWIGRIRGGLELHALRVAHEKEASGQLDENVLSSPDLAVFKRMDWQSRRQMTWKNPGWSGPLRKMTC